MGSRHDKEKAVNVQVLLRCRPFSEDELRANAPEVVTCNEYQREVGVSQHVAGRAIDRVFTFDKVFGPSARQNDLYDQAIVPIVKEVLEGFNCTIFAYGQTGTGKTYTMEGDWKRCKNGSQGQLPTHAGVIPRAVKQIFDTLESQHAEYSVKVTFLELYNEEITDLLAPDEISKVSTDEKQKKALLLMEDGKGGVLVRGLEEEIVNNAGQIFNLLERGSAKRRTAETLLNKQSSRSHSLFSITIHIKEATPEGEELIKCGKLNLVDLAGSENISRSGARENRAREAGEINKSLLTLGRVITTLVEHQGHIPYRDSKLTRLLRDSLGGRTKTCIIATVSPSVHCLDETLSTLDYAHRAKNIKNRPEVNQKMMKSALIKDLYGEIERLKTELYASREKVGVYVPKDRYYQEELERKSMADQIEQMNLTLENNQKQIEELQGKYTSELQHSSGLRKKLSATEDSLEHTSNLLATAREDLRQSHYAIREKDFVISEQKKAENALMHQAFLLRSDLEKRLHENASLFSKIASKEQLSDTNKKVITNFQADAAIKIGSLCNTVVSSIAKEKNELQKMEELCKSSLEFQDQSFLQLKEHVSAARIQFLSHLESLQNAVHLHKAGSNGSLEEISSATYTNFKYLENLLAVGEGTADKILGDLQDKLSIHRCDVADFSRELRERFLANLERTKEMSVLVLGLLDKLGDESSNLQSHASQTHDVWKKMSDNFQKEYEERSRLENEKLLSEISNLISIRSLRLKELVGKRLTGFRDTALQDRKSLELSTSSMENVRNEVKRKWEDLVLQTESDASDGADFSSAKHCRMENQLQLCVNTVDAASKHCKDVDQSIRALSEQHLREVESVVKNATEANNQHGLEIVSTCTGAQGDAHKNDDCLLQHFGGFMEYQNKSTSGIIEAIENHSRILTELDEEHAAQAKDIGQFTENTFQHSFKEYEPSGNTPVRTESEIPSKGTIEALRALPLDALLEEYRENHPYVSSKESKPSLIPRSPLLPLN